jgi:hypothetical protein
MNRRKKLFDKLLKVALMLLVLFFCFYEFLLSDYNPMFDDDIFKSVEIKLTESRQEKFHDLIELYTKTHNIQRVRNKFFYNHISFGICPSLDIVRYFGYNFRANIKFPFVELIYSLKIEKEFTSEECLKTLFLNCDYLHGNIGIKNASKYYFKKEFEDLNQREKLTLIVMFQNPSLYNPIRRPEKVKMKVDLFEKIINKQNKLK